MEPIALKKSCDFCTQSKVKCSGGYPCTRCTTKGIQCFYSPRKKRGAPKKSKRARPESANNSTTEVSSVIITSSGLDSSAPLSSLGDWERRSWSVFFTLYKHYGTSCSLHWFNKQLCKMKTYLEKQGNQDSLRRLTSWMEALNIDVDGLVDKIQKCHIQCYMANTKPPINVKGQVEEKNNAANLLKETKNEKIPFIRLKIGYDPTKSDDVVVESNKAFSQVFGYSQESIDQQLKWTGGGFLPWGGDILSRILTKESDLLAFVQILAIKFNSLGRPKFEDLPYTREVPSCHMFEVKIRESSLGDKFIPVNCLLKCVHREVLSREGAHLDINMEFSLMAPHEHLLVDDPIPTKLSVDAPVTPFPVRKNKRTAAAMTRDDSLKLLDHPMFTDTLQTMEEAPSQKPPLNKGYSNNSLSVENIPKDFMFTEQQDTGLHSPETFFDDADGPDDDDGLLDLDTEAAWFDELLGWAGKQEVPSV